MKGVYVMDLDTGHLCMILATDFQDAEAQMTFLLTTLESKQTFDGSYHYYPILQGENDRDAERRVYILLGKRFGLSSIYVRREFLESIGKGTYGSDMEIRKMMNVSSMDSIPMVSEEKDLFQMSI